MRLWCVHDNYLYVYALKRPFLLLFLVFSGDSKLCFFQRFQFFMKLILLHYNWQQNCFGKIGDVFQFAPT